MSSRSETQSRPSAAHWTTSFALFAAWALVVLLLLYVLEVRPRLRTDAPTVHTVPTAQSDFPSPPESAVVFGRAMGEDALALAVLPESGSAIAQASVVGPRGEGVTGLDVTLRAGGLAATGRSCGTGCYRATLRTVAAGTPIEVVVDGDSTARWSVRLPERWPPTDARQTLARAERAWRGLRSLSFEETLRSRPENVVRSSWQLHAPNRLAYQIAGGASAVVVGEHRWDQIAPDKPWTTSPQAPVRQPVPPWADAVNAHVVATTVSRGRPASVITFFDPKTPAWFRATIDRESHRTYDVRMVATAHFMHDRFHSFNETPPIRPPTASR